MRSLFICSILVFGCIASVAAASDAGIDFLENRVRLDPDDFLAWNQLAERYHRELRRPGDDKFIRLEIEAAAKSLKAMPAEQNPEGLAAHAQALLTAHRFNESHMMAEQLRVIQPGKIRPLELLVDTALELGDYKEAKKLLGELNLLDDTGFSAAARLAKLCIIEGKPDRAREQFEKGLTGSTGTEPENLAWFHLQLGELAFKNGEWDFAEKHYSVAGEIWPEGYSVIDHIAELRGAQGKTQEAIALYERLVAKIPRPEFCQALGDLYVLVAQPEKAADWHKKAETAYLKSVNEGAVHFYHHLAGFYSDSKEDAVQAVEWARKDIGLRQSIYAHDALAWALFKKGEVAEAAAECGKALGTGTRDPHLLYHASLIRMGSGDIAGGREAMQQATAVNPKFNTFHVHR